jgi:8-oxo-dGTP pyrophosphatase MutT (NUDIX family)
MAAERVTEWMSTAKGGEDDCNVREQARSWEMTMAQGATDSATVIPLRETDDGFEVFMVRRHGESGFMAHRYVYPGGKLDEEDCTERAARQVAGMTPKEARERLDEEIPPLRALGLFLAGARETFEESGLLLARRATEPCGDAFVDLESDEQTAADFAVARRCLAKGAMSLTDLAVRQDLVIPLDRLGYFAHWITPYIEERRYDTRFFVVLAPANQTPVHGDRETTDSAWMTPEAVLERNREGDLMLAPPTLQTLEQLANFGSADDVLEFARSFDPPTVLPHIEADGGKVTLYLPGDPDYPADDPDYGFAEPVGDGPTRLEMVERGVWRRD